MFYNLTPPQVFSDTENSDSVEIGNPHPPPTANHHSPYAHPSTRLHPGIKGFCTSAATPIYPPPFLILPSTSHPPDPPPIPLIYLCYLQALFHALSCFTIYHTMVSTCAKNQHQHPAAPVMMKATKVKAGVPLSMQLKLRRVISPSSQCTSIAS